MRFIVGMLSFLFGTENFGPKLKIILAFFGNSLSVKLMKQDSLKMTLSG
jgi:hypothetical protein